MADLIAPLPPDDGADATYTPIAPAFYLVAAETAVAEALAVLPPTDRSAAYWLLQIARYALHGVTQPATRSAALARIRACASEVALAPPDPESEAPNG